VDHLQTREYGFGDYRGPDAFCIIGSIHGMDVTWRRITRMPNGFIALEKKQQ